MRGMSSDHRALSHSILWGALYGLAAWSAYAATEVVFSSLLFGLTRPYSIFTPWHWQLTWLLVPAFFLAGIFTGAVAGAAVFFVGLSRNPAALECAASLSLVLAFIVQVVTAQQGQPGWYWLLFAGLGLVPVLLASIQSSKWHRRFGFLSSPWVISALLLGVGEELVILEIPTARQLGVPVDFWAIVMGGLLALLVGTSVVVGRMVHGRFSLSAAWKPASAVILVLLVFGSELLTSGRSGPVQASAAEPASSKEPNVLLIVLDTVRADHLSIYGYPRETTPNLAQLARDSELYTHAISAADFTLSSHASLFTGLYPSWHGAYCQPPDAGFGRRMDEHVPTLAEILDQHNYFTAAVAANLYLRTDFGLSRGFQNVRIPRPVPVLPTENWYLLRRPLRRVLSYAFDTAQFDRLNTRAEDIDQELFSVLEQRPAGAPFFAFVNYMDAHFPYVPPAPFDRKFAGKNYQLSEYDLDAEQQDISGGQPVPPGYKNHVLSQYDGGIAYVDAQVGNVVRWLKQRNLYDNTMIVVTSDHGEAFGERSRVGHANSVYENLLHVVLMVKYPNSSKTGVKDQPVSLIDVSPTILAALGIAPPATTQGHNLLQPVEGSREVFGETFPCSVLQSPDCPRGCTARTVISWPYKFITSTNGKRELFDLSADPDETHELSAVRPEVMRQLNADLHDWMKNIPSLSRQKVQVDNDSLRRLKSLGYVQ
ncbi:MAG: hypothetical protein C5B51_04305 [Terriglobia bacterium]|nr:MAG: hypothetical protein C5B51_04305 [Terriglobia bacterium]